MLAPFGLDPSADHDSRLVCCLPDLRRMNGPGSGSPWRSHGRRASILLVQGRYCPALEHPLALSPELGRML